MSLRKLTLNFEVPTGKVKQGTNEIKKEVRQVSVITTQTSDEIKQSFEKQGISIKKVSEQLNNQTVVARKHRRDINASERAMERLRNELLGAQRATQMTTEEQRVLANQMRLGSGATERQRQEVAELTRELMRMEQAAGRGPGAFRNLRNQMGMLGHQFQDIAVQAQMGTNGFLIFAQQGSQIASLLGPSGPLIGAGIAVAGMLGMTLMPALFDSASAADRFKESMQVLNDMIEQTDDEGLALSESLSYVSRTWNQLSDDVQETIIAQQMEANAAAVATIGEALDEVESKFLSVGNSGEAGALGMIRAVTKTSEEGQRLLDTFNELQSEITKENLDAFTQEFNNLAESTNMSEGEFEQFRKTVLQTLRDVGVGIEQLEKLRTGDFGLGDEDESEKSQGLLDNLKEQYATYGQNWEASQRYKISVSDLSETEKQRALELVDLIAQQKEYDRILEEGNAAIEASEQAEQRLIDRGEQRLIQLSRQVDETGALIAMEDQWMTQLQAINPELYNQIRVLQALADEKKKNEEASKKQMQAEKARLSLQQQGIGIMSNAMTSLREISDEQSALYKAAFIAEQALAAASVWVNAEQAKWSLNSTALTPAQIATNTALIETQKWMSLGAIAGTTIAGVMHDGGEVPNDGTYFLQGGEYVQSRAEKEKNERIKAGAEGMPPVTVINQISTVDQLDADRLIMKSKEAVYSALDKVYRQNFGRSLGGR